MGTDLMLIEGVIPFEQQLGQRDPESQQGCRFAWRCAAASHRWMWRMLPFLLLLPVAASADPDRLLDRLVRERRDGFVFDESEK